MHTKATLWGAWTAVPSSCCVKHIVQMQDGTFIALAGNGNIMTLDSLGSTYVTLPNLDPKLVVKSIAVPGAGVLALGDHQCTAARAVAAKVHVCVARMWGGAGRPVKEMHLLVAAAVLCLPLSHAATPGQPLACLCHMPDAHKTRLASIESCKLNARSRHLPGACREDDHRQDPSQDAAGQQGQSAAAHQSSSINKASTGKPAACQQARALRA